MNFRQCMHSYCIRIAIMVIAPIIATLLILNTAAAALCPEATKIMPLGDSITAGVNAIIRDTDTGLLIGYRQKLLSLMKDSGRAVDLVGSRSDGWLIESFDSNHEGHSAQNTEFINTNILGWLAANTPNIILLHIGTNDDVATGVASHSAALNNIESILDNVRDFAVQGGISPIKVFVAEIIKQRPADPTQQAERIANIAAFNTTLRSRIMNRQQINDPTDQVYIVPITNVVDPLTELSDDLHPNVAGYNKMAAEWFRVLTLAGSNHIPICSTAPDTIAPLAPTVTVNPGRYDIQLTWPAVIDDGWAGWSGYRIYRAGLAIPIGSTSLTTFSDFSLNPESPYSYEIESYDLFGNISSPRFLLNTTTLADNGVKINAGSAVTLIDGNGAFWVNDRYFSPANDPSGREGMTSAFDYSIFNDGSAGIYLTARWAASPEMLYQIPMPEGEYEVRIHLMEHGSGPRSFSIDIQTQRVFTEVDILATVGALAPLEISTATSGKNAVVWGGDLNLSVKFLRGNADNPEVAGIEIIPIGPTPAETGLPTTPTILTSDGVSTTSNPQISLSWSASSDPVGVEGLASGVKGYRIFRDGGVTAIATIDSPTTSYTDTSVVLGTEYSYSIAAYDWATKPNSKGNLSPKSTPVLVTALTPDSIAPSVPTAVVTTLDGQNKSVEITWTASTDDTGGTGMKNYNIYRDGALLGSTSDTTTIYTDTTIVESTTYQFTVSAVDVAMNESAQSIASSVSVQDLTPPTQVGNVTVVVTRPKQVDLSWAAATDNGGSNLASYVIFRNDSEMITVPATETSYNDTSVDELVTYSYSLFAVDGDGNQSTASTPASIVVPDLTAPSTPTGLSSLVISDTQIDLSWNSANDGTGSGVKEYILYRDDGTGKVELVVVVADSTQIKQRYSDTNIQLDTEYAYMIVARDNVALLSLESDIVMVQAVDTLPPTVPGDVTAVAKSSTEIVLNWAASADSGGSGIKAYSIFRDGNKVADIDDTGTVSLSYTDTNLIPATTYSYTLVAYDTKGNQSEPSAATVISTQSTPDPEPTAPENKPAAPTNEGGGSISIWLLFLFVLPWFRRRSLVIVNRVIVT